MMLNILFGAAALAFTAVAVFVWTVLRTAVRDIVANTRRPAHRPDDDWTADPDAPVPFHVADVREPLYGNAAQTVRNALIAKGVPPGDLKRRAY